MSHSQENLLWVGNIEAWMDEAHLMSAFQLIAPPINIKLARDPETGMRRPFGFLQFATREEAESILKVCTGDTFLCPDGHKFRVAWSASAISCTARGNTPDVSLYVGNLDNNVTEVELKQLFAQRWSSVQSVRVTKDQATGMGKGFGFVRFREVADAEQALLVMQGVYCGSRPMRLKPASKNCLEFGKQDPSAAGMAQGQPPPSHLPPILAPTGHLVYFAGLHPWTTEADVLTHFKVFGLVYRGTAYPGTGAGVVEFRDYSAAENAVRHLRERVGIHADWVNGSEAYQALFQGGGQVGHAEVSVLYRPPPVKPWSPEELAARVAGDPQPQSAPALPAPAITNRTTAEAQTRLDRANRIGSKTGPSIEHFQELLRDPLFVHAFEQQVAQGRRAGAGGGGGAAAASALPTKLPWLLQDRPELFEIPASVERMNEDFLSGPGAPGAGGRAFPALDLALPCEREAGIVA
mmetsp:Transcript_63555/g.196812  ORF Transcript_63555/g.196812 Transcript_63555/m.196812 type:complete len:465 (+) Transcript_63555:78-1472(+)